MTDRRDDQELIALFRAGDDAAFGVIFERYRPGLVRFARKILTGSPTTAEDVVQEAMLRTSLALRRDTRHIELKPWLYRVTRNSALDELSRLRTDSIAIDDEETSFQLHAPQQTEPEHAAEGRSRIREVLGDMAHLPETQRHALIRREVDGISHEQLAKELGTTTAATKKLVMRARINLVKAEEARSSDCVAVRDDLLTAHDAGRRASAAAYRHLATCGACRTFRSGLKDTRKAAAILLPGPLVLIALGVFTGKAVASTAAKATAVKTGAATAGSVAAVGVAGLVGVTTFSAGDPAPQALESPALVERVEAGGAIPRGAAVVRGTVELERGSAEHPVVTLPCPTGLRVADLLGTTGAKLGTEYAPGTIIGRSSTAKVRFQRRALDAPATVRVSILCKVPDARGSVVADAPRSTFGVGAATVTVKAPHAYVHSSPNGPVVGSVRLGQPLTRLGEARGGFERIQTDQKVRGWVESAALR